MSDWYRIHQHYFEIVSYASIWAKVYHLGTTSVCERALVSQADTRLVLASLNGDEIQIAIGKVNVRDASTTLCL